MAKIDEKLLEVLVCPVSKKSLVLNEETNELICEESGLAYPIRDGIPVMCQKKLGKFNNRARSSVGLECLATNQEVGSSNLSGRATFHNKNKLAHKLQNYAYE